MSTTETGRAPSPPRTPDGRNNVCQRTACAGREPHVAGVHLDPRHDWYDGPTITFDALPGHCRDAAYALWRAGAPLPEVVDLAEEILRLRDQVAAVRVDADRQVQRAMARALDCDAHGEMLAELSKMSAHFEAKAERDNSGRVVLVEGLHALKGMADSYEADGLKVGPKALKDFVGKLLDRHDRAWREKPNGRATDQPAAARPSNPHRGR